MASEFNIINYLSGILGGYVFDKAVLERIALERDVLDVVNYREIDTKTKELLRADLAYAAYYSPSTWASSEQTHGDYTKRVGSQTISLEEKNRLYNIFAPIYKKYEDEKLEEITANAANLQWLNW